MQGKHKRFLFHLSQFILVIMGLKLKLYMHMTRARINSQDFTE